MLGHRDSVIVGVTYAAAIPPPDNSVASRPRSNPLAELPKPDDVEDPQAQGALSDLSATTDTPVTGVGAAGAVSVQVMQSKTIAAINDLGTFTVGGPVTVNADSNAVDVAIAGAIGVSDEDTGKNVGLGGALGINVLTTMTDAYVYGATVTANALNVTATHDEAIGAFTAGGAGNPAGVGASTAVAGSVSINLILPDTEAYVSSAHIALVGDSSVKAFEKSVIVSIAGSAAISGGTGGYGAAAAINMIGSPISNGAPFNPQLAPDQPDLPVADGATRAFITSSTITMVGGTLQVIASNVDPLSDSRIIAITGALGASKGATSTGAAGMLSVNLIRNDTEAYIGDGSSITEVAAGQGVTDPGILNLQVHADDESGIVAIGGAVGIGQTKSIGAALGYNQITSTIKATIDSTTVDLTGGVDVAAGSVQSIGGIVVGVAAGTGKGWAIAGSVLVNVISNTIDAHIANSSVIDAGKNVSLQAKDNSLIVALAGAVAVSISGSQGGGASISYNRISNGIAAYVDGSTVTTSGGSISLLATSTPRLVAIGAAGAGGAGGTNKGISGAGTLTINSIANTVDAHINSLKITATRAMSVNSSEAASPHVAVSRGPVPPPAAARASIAYGFIAG